MTAPEVVLFDVGGPIYDDVWYARALRTVLGERGSGVGDAGFASAYDACRDAQQGFLRPLAERFLGPGTDVSGLSARVKELWHYPPDALRPDVRPCLDELAGRCRLGILANQPAAVRTALERDRLVEYFDVWAISDELGLQKPDPRLFAAATRLAGAAPERIAYVGNRMDNDIRPGRAAGMQTVWVLRGEAPAHPRPEDLAVPYAAIRSLAELPAVLSLDPAD